MESIGKGTLGVMRSQTFYFLEEENKGTASSTSLCRVQTGRGPSNL